MAFGSSGGDYDGPVASINVTPLVDVMLVLLVIFMVTAPMLQQGVEVNLPKATTAPLTGTNEQIVLSIDAQGKVFLGAGNEVAMETLTEKMAAIMKQRPEAEQKVYIKADSKLDYGQIMQVMSKLYLGGITQIGLVSASSDAPDPKPAAGKTESKQKK